MEPKIWYFAYGSNMNSKRLKERVNRNDIRWQVGYLQGYELVFNKVGSDGSGKANIRRKEPSSVYGVLYLLTEEELQRLDKHEGVPNHYKRICLPVETEAGTVQAISYIAAEGKVREGLRPRCDYLEHLIKGAEEHSLPENYIRQLKSVQCFDGDD